MILDALTWVVVDTETTGPDPNEDKPVEIAAIKFQGTREVARWSTLVDPGQPIPPESSGVHHLIDEDVFGAPKVPEALNELANFISGTGMLVAHNAAFDRRFLKSIEEPTFNARGEIEWDWLCTYRLSRHLLPNAPNHKLSTLRYFRKLDVPRDVTWHRALGDAEVTAALTIDLCRLYEETLGPDVDVDELLEYARSPVYIRTWPFGKYYGRPIHDAPSDYIRWALVNSERARLDLDFRKTLESTVLQRTSQRALAS